MDLDELLEAADPARLAVLDEPDSAAAAQLYRRILSDRRPAPRRGGRRGSRGLIWLRMVSAVSAGAVVAAGLVLTATVAAPAAEAGLVPRAGGPASSPSDAAAILSAVAILAARQAAPAARRGQYLYTEVVQSAAVLPAAAGSTDPAASPGYVRCTLTSQQWVAAGGTTRSVVAPARTSGRPAGPACAQYAQQQAGLLARDSTALAGLPVGGAVGNAELYQALRVTYGSGQAGGEPALILAIGRLLQESQSPPLRSALYLVLQDLPGITDLGPATDTTGRPGITLGFISGPVRTELVIDPRTSALLQAYDVMLVSGPRRCQPAPAAAAGPQPVRCVTPPRAGSVVESTLQAAAGVVDSGTAALPGAGIGAAAVPGS
jgi:hypothetical protein